MSKNVYQSTSQRYLLLITGAYGLSGGIAGSTRLVIEALQSVDAHFDIIAFNERADAASHYTHLHGVNYLTANNNKLIFVGLVVKMLLLTRYQTIFCDHINIASILAPFAFLGLIRYIVRVHLIEALSPHLDGQGMIGLRGANKLHASEFAKHEVLKRFPLLKIEALPLALDQKASAAIQASPPAIASPIHNLQMLALDNCVYSLGDCVILHVGRMATSEQYKGQDVLIQAMPQILELHPQAQLVFAGQGDDMERLLVLARSNSPEVQAAIFFAGFVSEELLTQLYQQCYVFAMPSRGEGFGLVYIEAMRWAKPCIASRVDAAQYIVQHEITGLLVEDATSSESVAHTVINLLDDPERARQYGLAGYQRVLEHYTFEHFRERFLTSLNS